MSRKQFYILLFFIIPISVSSQINTPGGVTCDVSGPICADNSGTFVFQNNNDSSTNINNSIACLNDAPRPAWFFLRINQTGDLEFQITQTSNGGAGLDVDFVVWGPFASESGNCNNLDTQCVNGSGVPIVCPNNTQNPNFYLNDLDNSNIVDCSYSNASVESMTINNAIAGEFYALLVTNWAGGDGTIEIAQTNFGVSGSGSTDCSIINVDGILGPDQNICETGSIPLDANPNNDPTFVDYAWEFNDGTGFAPIPGTDGMSTITVSNAGQYQVTITDNNGDSDTDVMDLVVTPTPTVNTINPQRVCDNDNDGFWNFDFTVLNPIVLGAQPAADFTVSYHTNAGDAMTGNSPITGLYTNQNAYVAETIYARVASNTNPDCTSFIDFQIEVFETPTANTVNDQLVCDDNNDGFWDFDLNALRVTVLGSQPATDFTVTFHLSEPDADANLNPLPDAYTNAVAYQEETIWIRIENNANTDCFSTTSFEIDVFDVPMANSVPDQLICDDNNDGFWAFDLNALDAIVYGAQNQTQFNISYHTSQNDADFNLLPLTSPYTNQNAYQEEIIYIRIENVDNTLCADTTVSFLIDVFEQPTPLAYTYELCDDASDGDDTNGFVDFPLTPADIDDEVLNGQDPTQFTVTYHLDQNSADSNVGAITNLYTNDRQIFARVENNDNPLCYDTVVVDLVVNALPVINNMVELLQCDNDTDGFSDFNLTESEVLISANSANETFTYYLTLADANAGVNSIADPLVYTNTDPSSNPDIIYVRVENVETCYRIAELELFVSATQIPPNVEILYEECDTDAVDGDITNGVTTFNFSDAEAQIRAQSGLPAGQNLTFTYYETEADALAEINAIPDISNHRNDASPFEQEIYVRVDGDVDNACVGLGVHVRLRTINPTPNTDPAPIILCDDITVGDLVETFDLTQNEAYIFNGDPDVVATYYLSYSDANADINEILTPATYQNTNPTETIFVRVTNPNTTCYAIVQFDIQVNPLPDDSALVRDFFECENNTDFIFDFDLDSKIPEILNGQSPTQFTVSFYESQQDADNLANSLTSSYTNMSNPQQIFVAITNNTTGCSISTLSFFIEVNEGAEAEDDFYEECDVEGDPNVTQFDLDSRSANILDGQDPTAFSISYHDSFDDAFNNIQPLPLLYENLTNPQIVYARVSNVIRPDECFEIAELTLQVNPLPNLDLDDEYILCLTSNSEAVVDVPLIIDTGLADADYSFEWSLDGTILTAETGSSITPLQGGTFSVVVTDTSTSTVTMCMSSDSTEVIESGIPDTFTVDVTSEAFTGNNMLIAQATGNSTYEFSLDNGPWQLDGEFTDVSGGEHVVYVRDVNGCGILSRTVIVIDYPKFFTPNGDGNHDTWTIKGINTQPQAVIYIFDRYGKLLKQLSPTSPGWDGTFNGNLMPSSDYWFTLEYIEPTNDEMRTFSAHFALKR